MKNIADQIPIVFVHTGNQFYLKNAVKHAAMFNPENQIILIGDKSNQVVTDYGYKNVKHYFIDAYFDAAKEFGQKYIHLSSNHYKYELFCFQRWFIIRDFMLREGLNKCLCLDTDVLLYCNITSEFSPFLKYEFTTCRHSTPNATLMKKDSIERFTDFIQSLYTEEKNINILKEINNKRFDKDGNRISMGGVSDMTAFALYQNHVSNNVLDLIYPLNGVCFDGTLSMSDGFHMKDGLKEVVWKDNLPFGRYGEKGELVRFLGLHFQGRSKMRQHKYLLDDDKNLITIIPFSIRWIMLKAWFLKYVSGIKKARYMIFFFWNTYAIKRRIK
ncbi:hypothetical protein [uncultured Draconibacterium sp.]|uniref:hypothetical protein n=1 Tax=uncultured Draconibacterium sp. TaxID=1573823 RepID=UPI0032170EF4